MKAWPLGLLACLLLSGALADHVYSHRYVIEGRLVGSDGAPLPGRVVDVESGELDLREPCRDGPLDRVTDQWGDFRFCYHTHELEPGAAINVSSGNATHRAGVDVAMRKSYVVLRETNEPGIAPPNWSDTYRLGGRVWTAGPQTLEGIPVFGVAVADVPVNVTVLVNGLPRSAFETHTDGFGDFDVLVTTEAEVSDMEILVEVKGRRQEKVELDELVRRSHKLVIIPGALETEDPGVFAATDRDSRPGSETPQLSFGLVAAVAGGLALSFWLLRRRA